MTFHFLSVLSSISSADCSAQMYWFQPPLRGEKRLSSYLPNSSPTLLILPLSSPVDGVNCCRRGKHTPTMLARRPELHTATLGCISWSLQPGPTRDFVWNGEAARRLTPSLKTEGNYVTTSFFLLHATTIKCQRTRKAKHVDQTESLLHIPETNDSQRPTLYQK